MKYGRELWIMVSLAGAIVAGEPQAPLRPLKPIAAALLEADKPDTSEMAYACARGAALFTALSGYLKGNAATDQESTLADGLLKKGYPFYKAAHYLGAASKKSADATNAQLKLLIENYSAEIIRSKQLNNEILSASIKGDMEALKALEPLVAALLEGIERQGAEPSEPRQ